MKKQQKPKFQQRNQMLLKERNLLVSIKTTDYFTLLFFCFCRMGPAETGPPASASRMLELHRHTIVPLYTKIILIRSKNLVFGSRICILLCVMGMLHLPMQ